VKLVVGIILIFMSIVHVIFGEKMQVNILKKLEANNILIGSFRVMSLQGGLLLFAVGVVEIMVYALKKLEANNTLIGSFRVMSLQGGLLLFAVGVVEIMVYAGIIGLTGFAIFIPLGIVCLNVISVFIVAIVKHKELFKVIIPQFLIFGVIIILQLFSVI